MCIAFIFILAILDSPNMLIAEDEKIICEVTKDNETVIEEKCVLFTISCFFTGITYYISNHGDNTCNSSIR